MAGGGTTALGAYPASYTGGGFSGNFGSGAPLIQGPQAPAGLTGADRMSWIRGHSALQQNPWSASPQAGVSNDPIMMSGGPGGFDWGQAISQLFGGTYGGGSGFQGGPPYMMT